MVIQKKAAPPKAKKAVAVKAAATPKAPEKWVRTTVMIREINHGKIKSITYWEKKGIKEVVDEALKLYLKGVKVKPLPKKK
jgi:ribosomal protein S12